MSNLSAEAVRLDTADPLAPVRDRFVLPDGVVYLDGNSLGALPVGVAERLERAVRAEWGAHLIRAWETDEWWCYPTRVGDRIGRLIGAAPGQTIVGESTSVQFFNAVVAAARLRPGRDVIVSDATHFPTDRYLVASAARLLGLRVVEARPNELAEVVSRFGASIAVVALGAVDFRTGELWDLGELTRTAHAVDAIALWDLCHAVGALPLRIDADAVDLAVGCSYKYLCGGPGAPAFLYVAQRHQPDFDQPLTGWLGHIAPFDLDPVYRPAAGMDRARIGTPHMLSLIALDAALDVFDTVDLSAVRDKSLALSAFFLRCVSDYLDAGTLRLTTPCADARRGNQLTLRHPQAYPIVTALIERGVIGDMRAPDIMRFGFNGLYLSFAEVRAAAATLREVIESRSYLDPRFRTRRFIT
ncbi:kynureninase [Nocardia nova]|uniref:kynureninase n=1 Tax=Nocardia nova TaxID=37330 RepID=UPI0037B4B1A6